MLTNFPRFILFEVNGVRACAGPACVSQLVQRPCTRTAIKAVRQLSAWAFVDTRLVLDGYAQPLTLRWRI